MKIALYGGSFNPPHLGHMEAANSVYQELRPDIFLIMPDNIPPHKDMAENSPQAQARLEMCRLAFGDIPGAQISDLELKREGKSYTAHTVEQLRESYDWDELVLVMGSDMLLNFEQWYRFEFLLDSCTLAVLPREEDDRQRLKEHGEYLRDSYGARVQILAHEALPMSSSDIRQRLRLRSGRDMLEPGVYELIIKNGWYDALPELSWLREKAYEQLSPQRLGHVAGCETEAVLLANHWGEDLETAATAGILHDITKKLNFQQQLILCREYGIINDNSELENPKILHAKTGAAVARERFGVSREIAEAIRWHTTGKPDMSRLEKIIYLADLIEPTRDFPGLEELRRLAYKDLDKAMALALEKSIEHLQAQGVHVYKDSIQAYQWYSRSE